MKFTPGRIKFYMERLKNYLAWIQSAMILWMFFQQSRTNILWGFLAIPVGALIFWFDYKFVLTHELEEGWDRNKAVKKIMSDLEEFLTEWKKK